MALDLFVRRVPTPIAREPEGCVTIVTQPKEGGKVIYLLSDSSIKEVGTGFHFKLFAVGIPIEPGKEWTPQIEDFEGNPKNVNLGVIQSITTSNGQHCCIVGQPTPPDLLSGQKN